MQYCPIHGNPVLCPSVDCFLAFAASLDALPILVTPDGIAFLPEHQNGGSSVSPKDSISANTSLFASSIHSLS